jgi:dCMP deaminase
MRLNKHEYFSKLADLVSQRATCRRRKVGCVLVNGLGHVIATGYNGVPSGHDHCIDRPCAGAHFASGQGLDHCEAIHAEQNALLQCRNVQEIAVAYVTTQPCMTCTKLLLNTSCHTIIYNEPYVHQQAAELWIKNGRTIIQATDAISRSLEGEKDSGRL